MAGRLVQRLRALQSSLPGLSVKHEKSTRDVARERLQIILAQQRGSQVLSAVDMSSLQQELLQIVQKHIKVVDGADVTMSVKHEGDLDIFEMQVPVSPNR